MPDYEIRRVFLPEDTKRIRQMQSEAKVFADHYPEHKRWLDMALSEVIRGKRIAFGVYKTSIDEHRRLALTLVGSIILKGNRFTGVVELKNLFVQENYRHFGYGTSLYQKVEDYCTKAGFLRIETEIPVSELRTFGFLKKMGFELCDCYPSPYRTGGRIYRMWRTLMLRYTGDPFDLPEFSEWLLTNGFGFRAVRPDKSPHTFLFDVAKEAGTVSQGQQPLLLQGLALIKDGVVGANDLSVTFANRAFDLGIVFCQELEQSARSRATEMRIRVYDLFSHIKDFSSFFAHQVPTFSRREVAGFVLNINAEFFSRIADQNVKEAAFFKNGPVGKYLTRGKRLLLISEPSPDHPLGGVQSIGVIDDVFVGKPAVTWERYSTSQPIFSTEEYDNYTREKDDVLGLRVVNLEPVPTVDYHVLLKDIIKEKVEIAELGCCYLSRDMVDRFEKAIPTSGGVGYLKYDFVFSFASEDRDQAHTLAKLLRGAGASVFYDRYEEASLFDKDLFQHFASLFGDKGRFCVIFVSEHYKRSRSTNHELQQAQARAFRQSEEHILPIRMDDTQMPGINVTVGFADLRIMKVHAIAAKLMEKLRTDHNMKQG